MFLYRPTVQAADAREVEPGVQSFFLVLAPAGRRLNRRVRVGKKRMPPARARFWARVERVGTLQQVLGDQLEDERYTTRTRGERFQPGARLIAQGAYAIVRHGDHCHFAYRVDARGGVPPPLGEDGARARDHDDADGGGATGAREDDDDRGDRDDPDEGEGEGDEGGGAGGGAGGGDEPHVPDAGSPLMLFERTGRGAAVWTTGGEPALLDREGYELVLVGAGDDPEGTLGVDLLPYPAARAP